MTRFYQVRVLTRGEVVAERQVEALDALTAINRVEATYGEPAQVQYKTYRGNTNLRHSPPLCRKLLIQPHLDNLSQTR